jgi:hypothetical protein
MGNPLGLARMQVMSKKAPERPEAIAPVPEGTVGHNNPYRGIEDHGIKSTNDPAPTQANWDTREGRTYLPADQEYEPIPVRIVQEYGNEFRRFRIHAMTTSASNAFRMLGRNRDRTSVLISNPDPALTLYIGGPGLTPNINAFAVLPGKEFTIYSTDEIWVVGTAVASATQPVQALEYFSVQD